MNYSLQLNALLGVTVLAGFALRCLAVLTHRVSNRSGRLGLATCWVIILYVGVIFASIGKVSYSDVFKSFVILGLVYVVLDVVLEKLAKQV
jgi:lipopolysaccharide export LptBFGC system permease protein LptF